MSASKMCRGYGTLADCNVNPACRWNDRVKACRMSADSSGRPKSGPAWSFEHGPAAVALRRAEEDAAAAAAGKPY